VSDGRCGVRVATLVCALLLTAQNAAAQSATAQNAVAQPGTAQPAVAEAEPPPQPQKPVQKAGPQGWWAQRAALRSRHNQATLIVAAGRPGTTYQAMAADLAAGADGRVRILPIGGDGGLANLQDLLLLRGVDLAIVPANVLAHAKATKVFARGFKDRLAYLAQLYSEEVHIVVGPDIASIADLQGRRIAIAPGDGTARFTAKDVLERLGVSFEEVPAEPEDALQEVRSGTIAAVLLVAGKPLHLVASLPKDGRLRLLGVPVPTTPGKGEGYSPAVLLPDDYPALIPPGTIVETIAVGAVLMGSKEADDSGQRVARHAPAVLSAIARLAVSQRHPKWKDVNLGAALPGWSRVPAADAWLARAFAQRRQALQSEFEEFLQAEKGLKAAGLSDPQRRKLLEEFESWARNTVTSERVTK
jgi:TRAP-type uncharacterized transport system substrate-binding protein